MGENTALATEVLTVLDLVDTVVMNMKGAEEGKIVINMDCRKVWELLTSKKLKESHLAGDSGSIIIEIIELESKTKIEFECMHAKTKDNDDNVIENIGLPILLKHDRKYIEERIEWAI